MRMIRTAAAVAALLLLGGGIVRTQESLRIVPFISGDRVVVSFELNDAYNDALRARAWVDRTIGTAVVATTDRYENLTRRHTLTRTVDGRLDDVLVTEDDAVVKTWLTKWNRVPVADTSRLDPARDYYVRVTTRTRPPGGSLLGLTKTVTGQVKFTFVP